MTRVSSVIEEDGIIKKTFDDRIDDIFNDAWLLEYEQLSLNSPIKLVEVVGIDDYSIYMKKVDGIHLDKVVQASGSSEGEVLKIGSQLMLFVSHILQHNSKKVNNEFFNHDDFCMMNMLYNDGEITLIEPDGWRFNYFLKTYEYNKLLSSITANVDSLRNNRAWDINHDKYWKTVLTRQSVKQTLGQEQYNLYGFPDGELDDKV